MKDVGKGDKIRTGKGEKKGSMKEMRQLRLEGKSPKRFTFQEVGLVKGGSAEKAALASSVPS